MPFLLALGLQDLEDQILLAQAAGAGKIEGTGDLGEFGYVFLFEFRDCHSFTYGRFRIDKGGAPFRLEAKERLHSGFPEDPPGPRPGGIFRKSYYAALRCCSATLSDETEITDCGSPALLTRDSTSFMVSWMRVFGR